MSAEHPCEHDDCPRTWCYRDPENWDYDNPEDIQTTPSGGAIHLHVRFDKMEFDAISQAAERRKMRVTDYVRYMALTGNQTYTINLTSSATVPVTTWADALPAL